MKNMALLAFTFILMFSLSTKLVSGNDIIKGTAYADYDGSMCDININFNGYNTTIKFVINWKVYTLGGEPVINCAVAWLLPVPVRSNTDTYHQYKIPHEEFRKLRIYGLKFFGYPYSHALGGVLILIRE